ARSHPRSGPPQRLGERRARNVPGVAVADRLSAGDELDVAPLDAGVLQGVAGRGHAVLHEVAAPLAPRVHPHAEDGHLLRGAHDTARHFHTRTSCSSSSNSVSTTSSTSVPTGSTSPPPAIWPSTTIRSSGS